MHRTAVIGALTLSSMHTLLVVPTYNEAETIAEVLRGARAAVPDLEVVVVDDGSPDGTAEIAAATGRDIGGVHVLRRGRRIGFGDAYRAGFSWGLQRGAEVLLQMDADLSHDPGALPELVAGLAGHDLVIGSRYIPGGSVPHWSLHRRLLSRVGNRYAAFMLGLALHDVTSGYRAWRADMLRAIDLESIQAEGYGFQIEMAYRAVNEGARVQEVPITFVDRVRGESKMSGAIIAEAMLLVTRWGIARDWAALRGVGPVARPSAPKESAAGRQQTR
jgi:dolichol-phosphate mannosyltransferase